MKVTRLYEAPRVTKPYTETQWDAVMQLGEAVDAELDAGDVRLTMGGEPTFVAVGDRDADEWNIDALGPTKRGFATALVHRLRDRYGKGGFLHFGQGKWYPGEQLPRWALNIYWRTDGQPVWGRPELFVDERKPTHYTSEDARRFIEALAVRMGLSPQYIQPGYEDSWYYLWRERRLPVNVDPFKSRLDDEMERARLRRVFTQKLDTAVGYVLPVKVAEGPRLLGPRWITGPWFVRDERLYLMPGDSSMGLRLPLDSLPWISAADFPYHTPQDPYDARGALPPYAAMAGRYGLTGVTGTAPAAAAAAAGSSVPGNTPYMAGAGAPSDTARVLQQPGLGGTGGAHPATVAGQTEPADFVRTPDRQQSAHWLSCTALCVEVRDPRRASGPKAESVGEGSGVMYVFMPPMERLEDYLDLLSAIEATAVAQGVQLVLEGYPPPRDPRLKLLQVTPDPGVIEVNIHPVSNWRELVANTEFLYHVAWESRLSAEKFMTDGRHTGTGGGNHFVMGGATPSDSPFLRRPELLASLLLYWHNHPSLSYLFSGMFVGPTSQAPRVDEARNDQLYELEIALQEIQRNREKHGQSMAPWVVDRTLRNILIDVTGNTHRSEFSIDKLYSPDSATGRLGLLELRAFEMPPHARMSIAQQLLLRAMVARFWKQPCRGNLTRWGTQLHMALTQRNALEPWHVMGEENSAGGTSRYVDSSLERIEVHVSGFNESRFAITCNGHALPMQATGIAGSYVAGVRYKAWNPPSSLHPSIGIHAPLTFDVVDTWMQRSVGGCQYHVAHPGGLSYDSFPVNANEAESRRLSRFVPMGHTAGTMPNVPASIDVPANREFPFTLDLRHRPAKA